MGGSVSLMMTTPERIQPGDDRYRAVLDKRFNKRFEARPDYVCLIHAADEAALALEEAVRENRRVVVTSGGHCLEGFVSDPDVRVILDVSPLKGVTWDAERHAFAVGAGSTVGETFRGLHEAWGVVLPLGQHPDIGIGGHMAGGVFGFLHRQLGLACDYLHAVEVVCVDADGRARIVVASNDPADPHHDLWWAHTGGGAGTFGLLTRCWFRRPDWAGREPETALPRSPESIATFRGEWKWDALGVDGFERLLANFGRWCEANSGADSPNASLFCLFEGHHQQAGAVVVRGLSTAGESAPAQIAAFLAQIREGAPAPAQVDRDRSGWLEFALKPFPDLFTAPPGGVSMKVKDALLRRALTPEQIRVASRHLTGPEGVMGGMLGLATYGGRINRVAPDATAASQRGAIIDLACTTGWLDPADADRNLAWVRAFYAELFATSGGAPTPSDAYEGALINHPDVDLADPALNRSGVLWSTLYFGDGYARLQRIKSRWDPRDVFRHALSVRPA